MHELPIARAVVAVATRHARGRRVVRVDLRIGHLRQVVAPALAFAFELSARETSAEGAALHIVPVAAAARCAACGAETVLNDFPFACPACANRDLTIVRGEELLVDAIEVED